MSENYSTLFHCCVFLVYNFCMGVLRNTILYLALMSLLGIFASIFTSETDDVRTVSMQMVESDYACPEYLDETYRDFYEWVVDYATTKPEEEKATFISETLKPEIMDPVISALNSELYGMYGTLHLTYTPPKEGSERLKLHVQEDAYDTFLINRGLAEGTRVKTEEIVSPSMTEKEAADAIMQYLIDNLEYSEDYQYNDGLYAEYEGKANCEGYSQLFTHMCRAVGIPCYSIIGYAGGKEKTCHEWNKVCIEGEWFYVDVCWADSTADDAIPYRYSKTLWDNHILLKDYTTN